MLIKNIQKQTKLVLVMMIVISIGSFLFSGAVVVYSFDQIDKQQTSVYVLDNGVPLLARSQHEKITRKIEYKSHINSYHRLFYTLIPDDKFIRRNLESAMYLVDESGISEYTSMKENGYYRQLISQSITSTLTVDSVVIHDDLSFDYYGTQRLDRKSSITKRKYHSQGNLSDDIARSDQNPHGVLITDWRVIDNSDIETKEKRNF
ncbi:MAG: conjugative transposon protein TraK [Flavobacteriales bacterium]|jgi:conjugative transposon TraK protein